MTCAGKEITGLYCACVCVCVSVRPRTRGPVYNFGPTIIIYNEKNERSVKQVAEISFSLKVLTTSLLGPEASPDIPFITEVVYFCSLRALQHSPGCYPPDGDFYRSSSERWI